MTLEETLERYRGQHVKIGAASSFIFCGRIDDNTASVLTDYANDYLLRRKKDLERAKKEKNKALWSDKKRQIVEAAEEYIKTFTPILGREVKEVYRSLLPSKVKIIIVAGGEIGGCWDKREYLKKQLTEEARKNDGEYEGTQRPV